MNAPNLNSISRTLYSKSEIKDSISNINDLSNSKGGFYISRFPEAEIEMANENGNYFKSFIDTPRDSENYNKRLTHKNFIYNSGSKNEIKFSNGYYRAISTQISLNMKKMVDTINMKTNEIEKTKEKMIILDKKIKEFEECNKIYEHWIENEEVVSEILINMLNYINMNNKK